MALLACERPEPRPPQPISDMVAVPYDVGCETVPGVVPSHGIVDAEGRAWGLDEIPGHTLRGLDLHNAEWRGVNLRGATLLNCDFTGCDVTGADLTGARFIRCNLTGVRTDGATGGRLV
jgi:uncharacterized protein YjbI with pentapeptide repeats